jgi:allantoicase
VVVHTLHQHDAPVCDFSAERILKKIKIDTQSFNGDFPRELIKRLQDAVKKSVKMAQPVSHYSVGVAPVN